MGFLCGSRSPAEISTVDKRFALKPVNGVIYWHIADIDLTPDLPKQQILEAFNRGFALLASSFAPIQFEGTSDRRKAPIEIFFKRNGDRGLPSLFDSSTLAYAYMPNGAPYGISSNIYFNDQLRWTKMHSPGAFSLLKVFVHEVLHALGLDHSQIRSDILYPTYEANDRIYISPDTQQGIDFLYGEAKDKLREKPAPVPTPAPEPEVDSVDLEILSQVFLRSSDLYGLRTSLLYRLGKAMGVSTTRRRTLINEVFKKIHQ